MFARNLRLPVDLLFGYPEEEKVLPSVEYVADLQNRIDIVHQHARHAVQMASDRMKEYYDTKADSRVFEVGQSVWLHNPKRRKGISPKLSRAWEGPYLVIKRLNHVI